MTHDEMLEADAIAWANIEKLDALYGLFDLYCEEVGLKNYNEETDYNYSADEVLADLPDNSPHRPFVRAFINYIESVQE